MAHFAFTRQDETLASETTKTVPLTCHGHSRPITHISFSALLPPSPSSPTQNSTTSPNSESSQQQPSYYMITACKDNNPMLRDGLTGDWIGTFIGHKGAVWSARLSADASLAATGSADFSARVWDTFTGETLHTLQHSHIVRAVAFAPTAGGVTGQAGGSVADGIGISEGLKPERLATGGMEKRLRIFDLARVSNGTTMSNGAHAGVAEKDSTPFYEIGPGAHTGAIKSIVWSSTNLLTTASDDRQIRWWDLRSPERPIATHEIAATPGSCELNIGARGAGVAPGVLSVAAGKHIYVFDEAAGPGRLQQHIVSEREVASVAVHAGKKRFVTGNSNDTWVHVWDLETERELETGRGHHGPVWTTCFSPDGKLYATGSEDGTVKLWKFTEGAYGLWR